MRQHRWHVYHVEMDGLQSDVVCKAALIANVRYCT